MPRFALDPPATPNVAAAMPASGGKSRKFPIAWVRIQRRPSASRSERTATVFDGSRGSTTDQPTHAPGALASSVAAPRRTKSVAGSGRRFPMRSTAERKPEGRAIAGRRLAARAAEDACARQALLVAPDEPHVVPAQAPDLSLDV